MILARVQHHPSREDLLPDLIDSLSPLRVQVFAHSSDPPNPWENYRACLSDLPSAYQHILIIQDDALPCPNFAEALELVAARHLSTPVCLFLGAAPASTAQMARRAWLKGRRYTPLLNTSFVPLVAVLWPRAKAKEFLEWSETARKITRADDNNAARWMRKAKQPVMVTVPSLVQHNEDVPSVKGSDNSGSWCRACLLAEDGLAYDW